MPSCGPGTWTHSLTGIHLVSGGGSGSTGDPRDMRESTELSAFGSGAWSPCVEPVNMWITGRCHLFRCKPSPKGHIGMGPHWYGGMSMCTGANAALLMPCVSALHPACAASPGKLLTVRLLAPPTGRVLGWMEVLWDVVVGEHLLEGIGPRAVPLLMSGGWPLYSQHDFADWLPVPEKKLHGPVEAIEHIP